MKHFTIDLNTTKNTAGSPAALDAYLLDNFETFRPDRVRPALIICPGGAYAYTSVREGEPIAIRFNALGFQTFVLRYHAPCEYPTALCELAEAVKLVRERAPEWHIDPNKIAVSGFSAGGHLAANFSISYKEKFLHKFVDADIEQLRPNACVLSYPVITAGQFAHRGSFENLLGSKYSEEAADRLSLEKLVHKDVPPTFLWHTYSDGAVPVENSLLYALALRNAGVMTELHVFPFGGHGLALATSETGADENQTQPECAIWPELAARFLGQVM